MATPSQKVVLPTAPGRDWLWGLLLVVAVIITYLPVGHAGFVWDDDDVVVSNPVIVGPLGLKEIWLTNAADICPLTLTTFWVEHALWGLRPLPYHLVTLFLHAAGALMLWRVLRELKVPGAWLGAALWALHPVSVESVAWVSEMKNTQSGLFFLLAIFFFLRWLKARDLGEKVEGTKDNFNYAVTLLFGALAMASKSSTVILPVVLCLCAWWMEGRWQWRNLGRIGPIFLMSLAAGLISLWTQGLQLTAVVEPKWERSWPERFVAAGDAVWFYLGKLLWPHPLITVYPRWEIDAGRWSSYLPLAAVFVVLFILWFYRGSWARPWFFVFAYFLVALLPGLGLLDNYIFRYSLVFDHFQYLASMGVLALLGAGMVRLVELVMPTKIWLQSGLGAGVLLVLAVLSWQHAETFESEETLWTDVLAHNPDCWAAYNNLGYALFKKGQMDEAIVQLRRALEINPDFAPTHFDLGNVLFSQGQVDEAIEQYEEALKLDSNYAEAHNNLGIGLSRQGRLDEAIAQFQEAVRLKPYYRDAQDNLAKLRAVLR